METKAKLALAAAALVVGLAGVEIAIGEKGVAVVLVRSDVAKTYAYKERIVTKRTAEKGGDFLEGAVLPGETLVEVASLASCVGSEAKCLAGTETPKTSPCVQAVGLDCLRKSPADSKARFFGLSNAFPAAEASGTQCQLVTCLIIAGDALK